MGAESVAYHRQTVLGREDDHAGRALADYGSRDETPLVWRGGAAADLGLSGEVTEGQFDAVFAKGGFRHPVTGEQLVRKQRPGFEIVVSAPWRPLHPALTMDEVDRVTADLTAAGYEVVGTATSGQAARALGQETGIEARTLRSLVWRLDHGQLTLTDRAVVVLVTLTENRRQQDPAEIDALLQLRDGHVAAALEFYVSRDRRPGCRDRAHPGARRPPGGCRADRRGVLGRPGRSRRQRILRRAHIIAAEAPPVAEPAVAPAQCADPPGPGR
jgi:hypothetical protein